ncbi:tail fiber domain-containing protein [Enterobacter mori]
MKRNLPKTVLLSLCFLVFNANAGGIGGLCCPFSDQKLKENVKPLNDSLEKVLKLNGKSYNWKDTGNADIGLIAQDVESVYPEIVSERDGYKQVDYDKLVAPLIESIREQQKQIDELRKKLDGK